MHTIEPYCEWRVLYTAEEDERSPFFEREYSEFEFTNSIYGFCIHPQWDSIGSPTLFIKILYVDYEDQFSIIEILGEWNDCLYNDIMFLKRDVMDALIHEGITKFILIGENVLNFHYSDESYYEEWKEDVSENGGWIAMVNFRSHVLTEFEKIDIRNYFFVEEVLSDIAWRTYTPFHLFQLIDNFVIKQLH